MPQEIDSRDDIIKWLEAEDFSEIYSLAREIKLQRKGPGILKRGIVEFSNYCSRNCRYCGLNCKNENLHRYRMSIEEIEAAAEEAVKEGYETIVLQSGEDSFYSKETIGEIIRRVKTNTFSRRCPSCRTVAAMSPKVTLSIGERPEEDYRYWKKMGADRYLLKHETADSRLYEELHPGRNLKERLDCLYTLKELGYEIGSGFMVGLPGQKVEDMADNLLLLKEMECHMAGIGPYIENPKVARGPLFSKTSGIADKMEMTRRCIAMARILLPDANLPMTTAYRVLDGGEYGVDEYGANVIMDKFTPKKYSQYYEIYPGEEGRK